MPNKNLLKGTQPSEAEIIDMVKFTSIIGPRGSYIRLWLSTYTV